MQARQATKRSSIEEKLKVEKDAAKRILLKRRAAKAAQIEAAREERKSRQTEFKKQQEKEAVRIRQHAAAHLLVLLLRNRVTVFLIRALESPQAFACCV